MEEVPVLSMSNNKKNSKQYIPQQLFHCSRWEMRVGGGEGVEINVYKVMTKVMTSSRIIAAERGKSVNLLPPYVG